MNSLHKFRDFNTHPLLEKLLLESKLEFSDEFSQVLQMMGDNKFAQILLSAVKSGEDKDYSLNYVHLTDKDTHLAYTPQSKADRFLSTQFYRITNLSNLLTFNKDEQGNYKNRGIFSLLGFDPDSENSLEKPSKGSFCKSISSTISPASGKEYVLVELVDPHTLKGLGIKRVINREGLEKREIASSSLIWNEQRAEFKVAKLLKTILGTLGMSITETELADFAQKYKAAFDLFRSGFGKFDIVEGPKISYWYKSDRYYSQSGTLGNSCMKEKTPDFFKIYTENPDVCRMVILYDNLGQYVNGKYMTLKIVGRAIVWTLESGETFMDRVYGTEDAVVDKFINFAKYKGWYYKQHQNRDIDTYLLGPNGKNLKLNLRVRAKNCRFDRYPYMDTLCYIDRDGKIITNKPSSGFISCRSTGGGADVVN